MYLLIREGSLGTFVNFYSSIQEILYIHHIDSIKELDLYYAEWDFVQLFKIKKQLL